MSSPISSTLGTITVRYTVEQGVDVVGPHLSEAYAQIAAAEVVDHTLADSTAAFVVEELGVSVLDDVAELTGAAIREALG